MFSKHLEIFIFILEKIEVHASSKHIKFRVESCKSSSHLNSIRCMLFSPCLGWYPANLCLLWNYGMDFSQIYIMFTAFSRDVQSVLVFYIQLSRDIVSNTFVVTCPFMYTLFIYFVSKRELLKNRSLVHLSACNVAIDPHELVDLQIRFITGISSLCLGCYPANLCLLWNYGMDFSQIYIMFARCVQ
jgi:hypothetical protein